MLSEKGGGTGRVPAVVDPALAGCAVVIVAVAFLPLLGREVRAMRLPAPERAAPVFRGQVAATVCTAIGWSG